MYKDWRTAKCFYCAGHGLVSDYGFGGDFEGPKECPMCDGNGRIFVTPKDRILSYPGGPFKGHEPGMYATCKP